MTKVLFVTYGGGHVRMVVPVAERLRALGLQVCVLGLTGAAQVVRDAGLPLRQVKDYVGPDDDDALTFGQQLAAELVYDHDPSESQAYLGLSYAELRDQVGEEEAAARYAQSGRQAFLPVGLLRRIIQQEEPRLVVVTNSPRAEQAAALAARQLGVACLCMVDLFAMDEYRWIAQTGYADTVCVLSRSVKSFLVSKGREASDIVVTGNPAFDGLHDPRHRQVAEGLRQERAWVGKRLVLVPLQTEPPRHPITGVSGDPTLPDRMLVKLVRWAESEPDTLLLVRPREPGQTVNLPAGAPWALAGQDVPLEPLLQAVDAVVTLNSTVGLQAHLVGVPVVQVLGSVFDATTPLFEFGLAHAAVPFAALDSALRALPVRPPASSVPWEGRAVERVAQAALALLHNAANTSPPVLDAT